MVAGVRSIASTFSILILNQKIHQNVIIIAIKKIIYDHVCRSEQTTLTTTLEWVT